MTKALSNIDPEPPFPDISFDGHTSYASGEISKGAENEIFLLKKTIRTLVAMPAYNESSSIAEVIHGAKPYVDLILVVDDGSIDDTASIASSLGAMVVRHNFNRGYGGALQTIFATARSLNAEELIIIDSDGQHDHRDIPKLLAELGDGYDVVIGSRFNGVRGEGVPLYRKVGMKVLDIATFLAGSGLETTDSQSGFRGYGKRAIDVIHIRGDGMSAGSEILVQISDHHLKVAEVPIRVRYDLEDTSSESPLYHGITVLAALLRLITLRRPFLLFGIPGSLLLLMGLGKEFTTFYRLYCIGHDYYPTINGGLFTVIFGLLFVISGAIMHYRINVTKGIATLKECAR